MTYWQFLALFILPPIALLALTLPRASDPRKPWWRFIALIALFALVYTTPWDNYLIYSGIWNYGSDRVLATLGYVPVEEYLFFILQPVLTGLWLYHLLRRRNIIPPTYHPTRRTRISAAFILLVGALGVWLIFQEGGRYMGLILAWASPVISGMIYIGGSLVWARRRPALTAILIPTFYLWAADWWAIHAGIWNISASATLGWSIFGLPVEEAAFFLVTNIMVVLGLLLLLYPPTDR